MIKGEKGIKLGLGVLEEEFGGKKVKVAIEGVKKFEVEVPS